MKDPAPCNVRSGIPKWNVSRRDVFAERCGEGSLSLSGCSTEKDPTTASEPSPTEESVTGGYEGWWNATPASGDTAGLAKETVAARTDTGEIVDASSRDASGHAYASDPDDVEYTVAADPHWPEHSVVIIDTETSEVVESFPVDSAGKPIG